MAPARDSDDIKWYAPDPRAVLTLSEFHAPRRLMRSYRSRMYALTIDQNFPAVIRACAETREDTWLNDDLIALYCELHARGHAHSVEAWEDDKLIGGLYGVAVPKIEYGLTVPGDKVFCGESMFSRARDASKLALVHLVAWLNGRHFTHLDAQFQTEHLAQFGFKEMRAADYFLLLGADFNTGTGAGGAAGAGGSPHPTTHTS